MHESNYHDTARADDRVARAGARRALQDAYDWRDDETGPSAADEPADAPEELAARPVARRRPSISRTVGV
jgi:hypothetical protein